MTREEAIECLKFQNEKFFGGQSEALKMAISALSENKGELIIRQAVDEINSEIPKIQELFDIAYEYNRKDSTRTELSQKCTTYLVDVWQTLGAIVDNYSPTENNEDTKGEWVKFKNFEDSYYHIKCSKCGQYWSIDDHAKVFKYCFNCGAEMKGGE